jgi:membrane protein
VSAAGRFVISTYEDGYHRAVFGRKRTRDKRNGSAAGDVVAPALAGAAIVAGIGRSVIDRRRHDGSTSLVDQQHGRDARAQDDDENAKPSLLDKIGERVPWLRTPIAVQKRYGELQGNNLAASVTLQAFLSLFPLLLVAVAVIGFVAGGGTNVAGSVVKNLGLSGDAARAVRDAVAAAEHSRRAASIIGLAGLLWSGLGLISALQYGYDSVWQVEARGMKDKLVGLLWLAGAAVLFVVSAAITTVLHWLPGWLSFVGFVLGLGVSLVLWIWTSKVLPNRDATIRMVLPGAILGAVGLEILKFVGAFYVPRLVSSSSQLYGSIGIVFAILAWLLIFSRLIIYSAVLNVVLHERRAGTETATARIPAGVSRDATPDVNRGGRVEKADTTAGAAGR